MSEKENILMFILLAGFFFVVLFFLSGSNKLFDKKYMNCIEAVNKAIPDPNETELRSNFIKECYQASYVKK